MWALANVVVLKSAGASIPKVEAGSAGGSLLDDGVTVEQPDHERPPVSGFDLEPFDDETRPTDLGPRPAQLPSSGAASAGEGR